MIKNILLKIEVLQEFIENYVDANSVSPIDRDIILQNLRDIYIIAGKLGCEQLNEELDDAAFSDNDNQGDTPSINQEVADAPMNQEEDSEEEILFVDSEEDEDEENDDIEVELESEDEDEKSEDEYAEEEPEEEEDEEEDEEEEKELTYNVSDNNLLKIMDHSLAQKIIVDLFGEDEDAFYHFTDQLDQIDGFEDAIILIYQAFPDKTELECMSMLAEVVSQKFNS